MSALVLTLCFFAVFLSAKGSYLPTVLWHGMGDTCCYSFSMGKVKSAIEAALPGIYVYSVRIGSNIVVDEISGFIGDVNSQVDEVCNTLKNDANLSRGFNAVGFSQGGQFLRAYVERCNNPPVHNLITLGGQHQGVADIPKCTSPNETLCEVIESILALGAYNSIAQELSVQAQYFHDPLDMQGYLSANKFLPDINNAVSVNPKYKRNFISLNKLVLFQFALDTIVVPRESSWFGFYKDGDLSTLLPYNQTSLYLQDTIGLKTLDSQGKVIFGSIPGDHMQFTIAWFIKNVVTPYLS